MRLEISFQSKKNDQEEDDTRKKIEEDRIPQIDHAIHKVMQREKNLKHTQLVQGVFDYLASRFRPEIQTVEKRINFFIEREYLERVDGQSDTYRYKW